MLSKYLNPSNTKNFIVISVSNFTDIYCNHIVLAQYAYTQWITSIM